MRYLPILEEVFTSDMWIVLLVGLITFMLASTRQKSFKTKRIGLITCAVVYIACEILSNIRTNNLLEIIWVLVGTIALGGIPGFAIGMIMKRGMKSAQSASVICGSDGPTTFFVAGDCNRKPSLRQRINRTCYRARKKRAAGSITAEPHSLDEVCAYIKDELGFKELDRSDSRYQQEYNETRAAFILQYQPELLGTLAEAPQFAAHDEESLRIYMEENERRQKAAERIPAGQFDIDLHIFEKNDDAAYMRISIEKKYAYIGGSASGSQRAIREFEKYNREIYRFYGVTQEDIDGHTQRYQDLVNTLAQR